MNDAPAEDLIIDAEEGLFARDVDGHLIRMDKVTAADFDRKVTLTIDGQSITVKKAVPATDSQGNLLKDDQGRAIPRATTIYDAATALFKNAPGGNPIPVLCHRDYMDPVAVCRLCVVEISKEKRGKIQRERKLLPACQHRVEETMQVQTLGSPDPEARERIRSSVALLTELLMADHGAPCTKESEYGDCELEALARKFGIAKARFPARELRPKDDSSLVIAVDHNACILCDRCIRGCNDIRNNQVMGRMGKGFGARIAFDLDDPMGSSSCVSCGECMVSCPTGALTHRTVVEADPWTKESPRPAPVAVEELIEHPLPEIRRVFSGVAKPFLEWNARSIVRRRYKKGDVICREGEFGSTAFLIEEGSVEVEIRAPRKHVADKAETGLFGLVRRFTSRLASQAEDPREEKPQPQSNAKDEKFITIDAPVVLPYSKPNATMGVGDLFGEMTCMSFYPRSATVRAAEDCTLLEMLRNVLYIVQRSPTFRQVLEKNYRERAINNHLRSVALFASLRSNEAEFEQFVAYLRDRVLLRRCEPGETIFRQGAPADDGFYLVRTGFVKVSQKRPGGEHVLNYVGPGGYFGEVGLLSDIPEIRAYAPIGVRTATCTALDHVDLVRITAGDFRDIVGQFPDQLRKPLIDGALKALQRDRDTLNTLQRSSLGAFLGQGLMNAQSLLVLDLEKCTRCDECTKACADAHEGVTRLIREGLRFDKFLVASSCRSCLDPYCMVGCPVGSIRRRETREIIIEDWCIGCGKCAENCPYGNINMHPFPTGEVAPDPDKPERMIPVVQQKATTCDLCHDLGPNAEPSCVYACPHDAAHRMSGDALRKLVERAARF
jgi:CRP-like cAMP-binding protein/Fe-S-cluster-containing dehydrogenase component